jgi:hypothetical protein
VLGEVSGFSVRFPATPQRDAAKQLPQVRDVAPELQASMRPQRNAAEEAAQVITSVQAEIALQ